MRAPATAAARASSPAARVALVGVLIIVLAGCGAGSRAGLATFLRPYGGHDRLFAVHPSGIGVERLRTLASSSASPYYATLTFRVLGVTGTPSAADARIRVTSLRNFHNVLPPLRVGELGTLRLRHGVVTDSLTHVTYCAPHVDRCGL